MPGDISAARRVHIPFWIYVCPSNSYLCVSECKWGWLACMAAHTSSKSSLALSLTFLHGSTVALRGVLSPLHRAGGGSVWLGYTKRECLPAALGWLISQTFLFYGLCSLIIILTWEAFPCKNNAEVRKTQILLVQFWQGVVRELLNVSGPPACVLWS